MFKKFEVSIWVAYNLKKNRGCIKIDLTMYDKGEIQ